MTQTPDVYMEYHPDHYSDNSVRWAVDVVDNLLNLCYQEAKKDLVRLREPMEQSFFEKNREIEQQYLALYRTNPQAATELLNDHAAACATTIMETYKTLRNTLFEKYTDRKSTRLNSSHTVLSRMPSSA